MADDIDIEEHDVLESLRRRHLNAVVKTEPLDAEDIEPHFDHANNHFQSQWEWESHSTDTPRIKVETPEMEEEFQFGKIILGSKPAQHNQVDQILSDDTTEENHVNYNYNMSLVLEDWGPILQKNNCYCPDCEILFATVNALDAHKMVAHSFLVATDKGASPDRNKAIKSTAKPSDSKPICEICNHQFQGTRAAYNLMKHYKSIHRVNPSDKEAMQKLKTWKICNHCNIYFPSDTDLVKHLYELLPLNDKAPTEDDKNKRTPIKVPSAVKAIFSDDYKNPVKVYGKKPILPVNSAAVSNSHDFKSVKVKSATIVKDVKPVLPSTVTKQSNSIILGSKVNTQLDVKMETLTVKSNTEIKCEVCGIEYSRKYYTKHMRKFHLDFFVTKLAKLKRMQPPPNADRYKCKLCSKVLIGKLVAKKHRLNKHPEMGSRKILIRMYSKLKKTQPKAVPKTEAPVEEKQDIVVSKSTLFKCNRCSSHFLTCYGACAHSRVCESTSNLRYWICPDCQRVFKNADKKAHEFQHKANSAKFKVYVVYLEMVVRILCECPFCYVCFEEYKFWRHINFGCDKDAESFYCNECKLPIDATSRASHESKHNQGDFTKEDFIKIDFVSSKKELGEVEVKSETRNEIPTPTLKRKLPAPEIQPQQKRRKKGDFHLYYCSTCKCYMTTKVSYHTEGKCIEIIKNTKGKKGRPSCKICAISFTNKSSWSHKVMHKKYPNITLSNLVFTRISDGKKMKPNPEYYPCKNCLVNFTSPSSRRTHSCGSVKSFNCHVCHRKIDKEGQKAHMRFHTFGMAATKPTSLKIQQNAKSTKQNIKLTKASSSAQKLPELLKKYQSLTTLWNILYLCVTCDTFTDSYDKVVEHSQNHLTNMENYGVVIMKCQLCNMKFDSECYRRHLELHAGSRDISKKSFKILKYDHAKLFSKDWLSFIDLPEDRKSQILSRSIYGEMRSIRMKLVQQGPPEYTVYKCAQCQRGVSKHTLPYHINLQNCSKAKKVACSYCNISFTTKQPCEEHEEVHRSKNLGEDSFRIVEFNAVDDGEFYKKVMPEHSDYTVAPETTEASDTGREAVFNEDNVKEIKGQKFYMFYKCARCGVNTHTKKYSVKHICTLCSKKTCTKCGLVFGGSLHYHNKLHERYDFSKKNVFTKTFNNDTNNSKNNDDEDSDLEETTKNSTNKDDSKLFKCHCGLHYTSLKTIEKHYQMKNCSDVVREKCSQCNLIFDPIEVVNHLCKHHAQKRFKKFDIITPTKKTLYKCNQCHVLFYNEVVAVAHKRKCDGSGGVKCKQCGLAFHKSSVNTHREDHRTSARLKPDCYIVTNVAEPLKPIRTYSNTLYKCKKCNIHFMAWNTLRNHFVRFNHRQSQIEKCVKCGLLFPHISLIKHERYHHGVQKLVDFQFEYYEIGDRKPTPKKKETTVEDTSVEENNPVLKCEKCDLNFTDEETLANHAKDSCNKEPSLWCAVCNVKFAYRDFAEHSKIHPVQRERAALHTSNLKETDKTLIKCRNCNLHFNLKKTFDSHIARGCANKAPCVRCDVCDIVFTAHSSNRHNSLHKKYNLRKDDFTIITLPSLDEPKSRDTPSVSDEVQSQASNNDTAISLDSSFELETPDTSKSVIPEKVKIKLYKCGECNVYFLTQRTCYKHTIKHQTLDLRDFIECKLCGYQFTIIALQTHIKKHHATDFKLDEVLVEEYQPSIMENNVPKIEIYYAIEKDQSRLVSTTTDVKNISMGTVTQKTDDNGSSEVTSNCNEFTETVDSKQNFSEIEYLEDDLDVDAVELNDLIIK